jgi:hypothetical protein
MEKAVGGASPPLEIPCLRDETIADSSFVDTNAEILPQLLEGVACQGLGHLQHEVVVAQHEVAVHFWREFGNIDANY